MGTGILGLLVLTSIVAQQCSVLKKTSKHAHTSQQPPGTTANQSENIHFFPIAPFDCIMVSIALEQSACELM